jgi:hypothetical protein
VNVNTAAQRKQLCDSESGTKETLFIGGERPEVDCCDEGGEACCTL